MRLTKDLYRSLFELVEDGLLAADEKTRKFILANPRMCEITGYPEEELLAMSVEDLHPRDALPDVIACFERATEANGLIEADIPVLRKDGTIVWCEISSRRLKIKNRQALLGSFRDITDRRAAEGKVRSLAARLTDVLESMVDAFIAMDHNLVVTYFNAAAERVLRRSRDKVLGRYLFDAFPEGRGSVFDEKYHQAARDRKPLSFEVYFDVPPYQNWYTVRASPNIDGISVFFHVITEQKETERALDETEALVHSISNNLPGGVVYQIDCGPAGEKRTFTYISAGVEKIHGISSEAIMHDASLLYGQIVEEDRAMVAEGEARALASMSPFQTEARFLLPSGEIRWCFFASAPRKASSGHIMWDGIEIDVTERKRAEEALRVAMHAADSASRAKNEFLANMSHEIRTPLNGVMGMTQLLLRMSPTDQQKKYLDYINVSGKNLLSILNDILDLSRIEAGKLARQNEKFSVREVVESVIENQSLIIQEKNLSIFSDFSERIPTWLHGEPTRVRQILLNLIANAVKFTKKGFIEVSVALEEDQKDRVILHFSVRDTGIGIKPEVRDAIFHPFTQGDSSVTRDYGGTGLGLSICQRLVETLGGRIWVESKEGEGSTFHFLLPFEVPPAEKSSASEKRPDNGAKRDGGPLRVLIAEDNEINREYTRELLTDMGCAIESAVSGDEAIEKSEKTTYDLLLLDIRMPGKSGIETLHIIRGKERGRRTPAIAVTALALKDDRETMLREGFDEYLAKPFSADQLNDAMRKALGVVQ